MAIDISRVRNVGFVGHGGVGKTSLVEAILFRNGMTTRLGRVDDAKRVAAEALKANGPWFPEQAAALKAQL